ncbi:Hypothetical predicted protein [Pelobates cultripes]|uniref:Fcf2 pre-rRNA processing C-terminal domain-containing protein n=1 Tax=Pelobates cultripes TaxID=61616 RepID=A0AAD1T9X5_PELCU|nr:Hypothetical predicted protein [Pelobates cultripes]
MVATRRGMAVEPPEEREGKAEDTTGQPLMEVSTPASQVQTRNRVKRTSESKDDANDSTDPSESLKPDVQIVTRSRRRSGQPDGNVSEADSTTSSHSTGKNRHLTESSRKLRSHRSRLTTEPIKESKEDSELSEAESNCSSVSMRASNRRSSTISSTLRRSCRSVVVSESAIVIKEDEDISEVESNCSSVSGVQNVRRTRVTRSRQRMANRIQSPVKESQIIEISDAESCSSGISSQPLARRVGRRNACKSQKEVHDEHLKETNNDTVEEVETLLKKTSSSPMPVERSPEADPNISPRRILRNRQIDLKIDIMNTSVTELQVKEQAKQTSNKASDVEHPETSIKEDEIVFTAENIIASPSTKNTLSSAVSRNVSERIDLTGKSEVELVDVDQDPSESSNTKETISTFIIDDDDQSPGSEKRFGEDNIMSPEISNKSSVKENDILLLLKSDDSSESEQDYVEEDETDDEIEIDTPLVEKDVRRNVQQPSEDLMEDGFFVIDTKPGSDSSKKYFIEQKDDGSGGDDEKDGTSEEEEPDESDEDFIDEDEDDALLNKPKHGLSLSTNIDTGLKLKDLGGLYISFNAEKPDPGPSLLQKMKKEHKKMDELLKNSVITPDFEKKECVPSHKEQTKQLKKERKEERDKSSGRGWFDMKAPELTDELKNDLKALKMRSAMDPKRFYKKNDRDGFPKYFQVGTVVDNSIDFYHSRIPKKERKRTIVEELLADSEFRRYNKKKFTEIMAEKRAQAEGKKNRKKKKFRK